MRTRWMTPLIIWWTNFLELLLIDCCRAFLFCPTYGKQGLENIIQHRSVFTYDIFKSINSKKENDVCFLTVTIFFLRKAPLHKTIFRHFNGTTNLWLLLPLTWAMRIMKYWRLKSNVRILNLTMILFFKHREYFFFKCMLFVEIYARNMLLQGN